MTTSMFMAYVEEMGPVRARRQLDAADVALYSIMARFAPEAAASWRSGVAMLLRANEAAEETIEPPALFRLNGVPMVPAVMKAALSGALGAAFAAA